MFYMENLENVSKGNELLQELYERLKGNWYNQGKYAGKRFTQKDVKEILKKILTEYEKWLFLFQKIL